MAADTNTGIEKDFDADRDNGTDSTVPSDLLSSANIDEKEHGKLKSDQKFVNEFNRLLRNNKISGSSTDTESFKKDVKKLAKEALQRISQTSADNGRFKKAGKTEAVLNFQTKRQRKEEFISIPEESRSEEEKENQDTRQDKEQNKDREENLEQEKNQEPEDHREELEQKESEIDEQEKEEQNEEEKPEENKDQENAKLDEQPEADKKATEEPSEIQKQTEPVSDSTSPNMNRVGEALPEGAHTPRQPLKSIGNKQNQINGKLRGGKAAGKGAAAEGGAAEGAAAQGVKQAAVQGGKKAAGQAAKAAVRSIGVAIVEGLAAVGGPVLLAILGVIIIVVVALVASCSVPGAGAWFKAFGGIDFCDQLGLVEVDAGQGGRFGGAGAGGSFDIPAERREVISLLEQAVSERILIPQENATAIAYCRSQGYTTRAGQCFIEEALRSNDLGLNVLASLAQSKGQAFQSNFGITGWVEGISHPLTGSGEHGEPDCVANPSPANSTCGRSVDFNAVDGIDIGVNTPISDRQKVINFGIFVINNFNVKNYYGPSWLVNAVRNQPGANGVRFLTEVDVANEGTHNHVQFR